MGPVGGFPTSEREWTEEKREERGERRHEGTERRGKREDMRVGPTFHVDAMSADNNHFNTV